MNDQRFCTPQDVGDGRYRKRLEEQRTWTDIDETHLIRVQKAFTRFEKISERHAGALTMAWATLESSRH